MKSIHAIIEKGKDGYGVFFEELDNVFAFGESVELAKEDAYTALNNYVAYLNDTRQVVPQVLNGAWTLDFSFDVQAMLNYFSKVFTSTALSNITGVNASLIRQYALGLKKPRQPQIQKIERGLHNLATDLSSMRLERSNLDGLRRKNF